MTKLTVGMPVELLACQRELLQMTKQL